MNLIAVLEGSPQVGAGEAASAGSTVGRPQGLQDGLRIGVAGR